MPRSRRDIAVVAKILASGWARPRPTPRPSLLSALGWGAHGFLPVTPPHSPVRLERWGRWGCHSLLCCPSGAKRTSRAFIAADPGVRCVVAMRERGRDRHRSRSPARHGRQALSRSPLGQRPRHSQAHEATQTGGVHREQRAPSPLRRVLESSQDPRSNPVTRYGWPSGPRHSISRATPHCLAMEAGPWSRSERPPGGGGAFGCF